MTENVIIDFTVDYSQLTNAQEQLAKTGKIDDKGFQAIQAAINTTATDTKGLVKQFKEVAGASIKMGKTVEDAFGAGIQDALDEAGVSVDEFAAALKKTTAPTQSLKKELLALKESLARMKAEGKDTGKEFDALRTRAGKLQDAISDANAEIKNAGSDTRGIDNVIGSISALAGGYAAVQGAAALFGDENEDLQKTLVKVNSAMALATGIQQVFNAVQKEGSLIKLADSIQSKAAAAAQYIYTVAVGTSTGAMKAFRIALLATGIGAIIVLIGLAADAMGLFGGKTEEAADKANDLADGIKRLNTELDNTVEAIKRNGDLQLEFLKQRGASEKELHDRTIQFAEDENRAILSNALQKIKLLGVEDLVRTKQDADNLLSIKTRLAASEFVSDKNKALLDEQIKGLQEVSDAFKKVSNNEADITLSNEQFKTKVIQDANKKREELNKKRLADLEKQRLKEIKDVSDGFAAILKRYRDEEDQLRIHFENEQEILDRDKQAKLAIEKKWDDLRKEMQASMAQSSQTEIDRRKAEDAAEEDRIKKRAEIIIGIASQVGSIFAQLGQRQTDLDNQRISSMRKVVDEQLKAGVITEKAAIARQKQIDVAERVAKQRAAEREKKAAVFTALLAIPRAFLQGLSQGGIYLAAIYAALAAAEAALVISRPVPKFFKGKDKTNKYEGPGIIADMGPELRVNKDGRMYLYTKPTQTYLGADDKVYTAAQTRQIMHSTNINTTVRPQPSPAFDYERLGKAIPSSAININIDKDFISESVANGLQRTNYMDRRYSSRR